MCIGQLLLHHISNDSVWSFCRKGGRNGRRVDGWVFLMCLYAADIWFMWCWGCCAVVVLHSLVWPSLSQGGEWFITIACWADEHSRCAPWLLSPVKSLKTEQDTYTNSSSVCEEGRWVSGHPHCGWWTWVVNFSSLLVMLEGVTTLH